MNIAVLPSSIFNALRFTLIVLAAFVITACGGDDAQEFIDPNSVVDVSVSPSPGYVDIDDSVQLSVEIIYGDRERETTTTAEWSSADESIATVSGSGLVTAVAQDFSSVEITAVVRGVSDTVTVDIGACGEANPDVQSLLLDPADSAEISTGELLDFTATASYCTGGTFTADRTNEVTWESTDPSILEIGADGRAVARSSGTVTVSAELDGIEETVEVTVAAAAVQVVQVTPTSAEVVEGFTLQMKARAIRSNNTQQDVTDDVTWASSDEAIATVDASGVVTGVSGGAGTQTAVITATFDDEGNDVSGSRGVDVIAAVLQSIEILAQGAEPGDPLATGLSRQYGAFGTFEDGEGTTYEQDISDEVTWQSSCEASLTIESDTGFAEAVDASNETNCPPDGVVTITVTGNGTAVTQTQALNVTAAVLIDGSLEVTPDSPAIAKGETQQFNASGDFTDGSTDVDLTGNVTWSVSGTDSSGNEVASIDESTGLAEGLNQGGATVSALFTGPTQSGSSEPAATAALQVGGRVLVSIAVTSDDDDESVPLGATVRYTATGTYSDSETQDITNQVVWGSTDTDVADIDSGTGVATTGAVGTATISATQDDVSGTLGLTVTDAELVSVVVDPDVASVSRGDTVQLEAIATYTDGSEQNVTADAQWSSDNDDAASVGSAPSTKGKVTGKAETAEGAPVTISASVTVGSITEIGTASVTVTPPRVVSLLVEFANEEDGEIAVGDDVSLTVTAFFADGSDSDVTSDATYQSTNESVASVNANGVITGVSQGTARVDVEFSSGGESEARFVDITVTP